MKLIKPTYKILFLLAFMCSTLVFSQSKKQQELEERRQELHNEIKKINDLLFQNKSEQKSQISLIEDLNYKVSVRKNLIKITNQQANLLTREINTNQKKITGLRDDLKKLKDDYAKMIVTSYKSKSEQSRVMFLLSSTNFKQAYKRVQYINQYTKYQKQQGETIKVKTTALQKTNTELLKQKSDKQVLIKENRVAQRKLEIELKQHEVLISAIKKDLAKHTKAIRKKQREAAKIDREIEKIIRDAIARSNAKAGKTTTKSSGFALTPAGKALAKNFEANKGKLDWPLKRGIVKTRYGKNQPHPIDKTLRFNSNGVRIQTGKNAKVYAIFKGEVLAIQIPKRGTPSVYIKHGNYVSVYKNITKLTVKKGDKITRKQVLGEVLTNPSSKQTILNFSIHKDAKSVNPAHWIYKM